MAIVSLKQRIKNIIGMLKTTYPRVETQLHHKNPFELLIATILSAQCTDRQVNHVAPVLFSKLKTPMEFINCPIEILEDLIRPTGYYRNKAKHIRQCCLMLVEKFNGEVPSTMEELLMLPGVGRKTANVILGAAFGIPGIVVDTHVIRLSQRLGFTKSKNPSRIERDLMEIIPRSEWNDFCLRLIFLGREFCKARHPKCPECPLNKLCPYPPA